MTNTNLQWWRDAQLPGDQRVVQAVVFRKGGEKTAAIVNALVSQKFGNDGYPFEGDVMLLHSCICQAVSDWLRETEAGRRCIESTHFGFSAEDLADLVDAEMDATEQYDPEELGTSLRRYDILALHVETYQSDEERHTWDFDDALFDDLEINADYYAEGDRRDAKRCTD